MIGTLRVRLTSPETHPPEELLSRAARLLGQVGFKVLHVGRFGVSVEASPETFASELGLQSVTEQGQVEKPNPRLPELAELVDLLEVTPPPTYFP